MQTGITQLYSIKESNLIIYLSFHCVMCFFRPIFAAMSLSQMELYHGWKVYEYLVYSRYRFLQREVRWKGMEDSLDECIEDDLRKMDQMCFSSQYFTMLTVQFTGITFIVQAFEIYFRFGPGGNTGPNVGSPFSDSAFPLMALWMMAVYCILQYLCIQFAIQFKLWAIKHENTKWHGDKDDDDDMDLPDWDDIKGASHDAYLMNQRITSDTFRFKFLNYNRAWLIQQLPSLLTPRTLRRSRPYLINQLARVIGNRRQDISDDSEDDAPKFGKVALTAPSRSLIRWWLAKARRRMRLRQIVEPLISKARGPECERCLSRKQLQVECEIDLDEMARRYDEVYPGDEEVDQIQWKNFWQQNQRHHTICLKCITDRREGAARRALDGAMDDAVYDAKPEEYPDFGPVYVSAASKAIMLNWYNKAKKVRDQKTGKRKGPARKEKVIKGVSDDEGDDVPIPWKKERLEVSDATAAIAIKWQRTARARLQKRRGKGGGARDERDDGDDAPDAKPFRSGQKSKMVRK